MQLWYVIALGPGGKYWLGRVPQLAGSGGWTPCLNFLKLTQTASWNANGFLYSISGLTTSELAGLSLPTSVETFPVVVYLK